MPQLIAANRRQQLI